MWLVWLASLLALGIPCLHLQGWNDRWAPTLTQHLLGFWESDFQPPSLCGESCKQAIILPASFSVALDIFEFVNKVTRARHCVLQGKGRPRVSSKDAQRKQGREYRSHPQTQPDRLRVGTARLPSWSKAHNSIKWGGYDRPRASPTHSVSRTNSE